MRNKLLNNNLADSISKGGVLYRAGEIPILTKEQIAQANLVSKLPRDFPFAKWEGMSTKQQLREMKSSGLNDQDQWSLLNSNVPLAVLNEHNQVQENAAAQASPVQAPSLLSAKAVQVLAHNIQNASTSSSISPSLQASGLKQKLNMLKEEYKQMPLGKASGSVGAAVAPKSNKPTKAIGNVTANVGVGFIGHEEHKSDSKPSSTPQMITFETEPPTKTPRITPTPSSDLTPIPIATSTPTHFLSLKAGLREALSNRAILAKRGVDFVTSVLGTPYSSKGRYGTNGYDCSGLVISMCDEIGSKLPFGNGIRETCKYGMSADFRSNPEYGSVVYDHEKSSQIQYLQKGDLIFYADPSNLRQDAHVSIVTGNMIYDSETKTYWPEVIEASGVSKNVTNQYPAFNIQDDGEYIREYSGQVVTYVIRPNYDWEEQP